jgi:hypothetical protein
MFIHIHICSRELAALRAARALSVWRPAAPGDSSGVAPLLQAPRMFAVLQLLEHERERGRYFVVRALQAAKASCCISSSQCPRPLRPCAPSRGHHVRGAHARSRRARGGARGPAKAVRIPVICFPRGISLRLVAPRTAVSGSCAPWTVRAGNALGQSRILEDCQFSGFIDLYAHTRLFRE